MPDSTGMLAVMRYFGMKPAEFKTQWAAMTDTDKEQLKNGVGTWDGEKASGSLTY